MAECEICGQKTASVKAEINGVLFSVCKECAALGRVVEQPKPITRPVRAEQPQPEEIVIPDFAKVIAQARQEKGLKQDELAKKLNEKLSVIRAVESGRRAPDLNLAKKLERFLNIKLIEEA